METTDERNWGEKGVRCAGYLFVLGTGANALDALNRSRVALLNDSQQDRVAPVVGEDRTLAQRPTPDTDAHTPTEHCRNPAAVEASNYRLKVQGADPMRSDFSSLLCCAESAGIRAGTLSAMWAFHWKRQRRRVPVFPSRRSSHRLGT